MDVNLFRLLVDCLRTFEVNFKHGAKSADEHLKGFSMKINSVDKPSLNGAREEFVNFFRNKSPNLQLVNISITSKSLSTEDSKYAHLSLLISPSEVLIKGLLQKPAKGETKFIYEKRYSSLNTINDVQEVMSNFISKTYEFVTAVKLIGSVSDEDPNNTLEKLLNTKIEELPLSAITRAALKKFQKENLRDLVMLHQSKKPIVRKHISMLQDHRGVGIKVITDLKTLLESAGGSLDMKL